MLTKQPDQAVRFGQADRLAAYAACLGRALTPQCWVSNRRTASLSPEALHPYGSDVAIVTKVGAVRGKDGSWNRAFSREELTQAVHDNLRNLGLDVLDVVNLRAMFDVHQPAEGSRRSPPSRQIPAPQQSAGAGSPPG